MRKPRLFGTIGFALLLASTALAQVPPGLCSLSWRGDAAVDYHEFVENSFGDIATQASFSFEARCSGGGGNNQCLNNCCCFMWMRWNPDNHAWETKRTRWYNGGPYSCGGTYPFSDKFFGILESYGISEWQLLCVVFAGDKSAPGVPLAGWQRFFWAD